MLCNGSFKLNDVKHLYFYFGFYFVCGSSGTSNGEIKWKFNWLRKKPNIKKNGRNLVPKWFLHVFCTFVYSHTLSASKKKKRKRNNNIPLTSIQTSSIIIIIIAANNRILAAFEMWIRKKRIFYCECENNFLCIECGRRRDNTHITCIFLHWKQPPGLWWWCRRRRSWTAFLELVR